MERFRSKDANCLSELLAISDSIRPTSGEISFEVIKLPFFKCLKNKN